ncbi:MAG: putative metallopeptidase [Candidatus Diapherotrites archaeon]|nr:putative metallopeptidase [Candidatus Diapherotrites archaeon]
MKYSFSPEWTNKAHEIASTLNFDYIDHSRISCIISFGSKARAYARIHGTSKALQIGMNMKPCYVIELISEKFNKLDATAQTKVLIHELMHVPQSFAGGFRNHKQYVRHEHVEQAYQKYVKLKSL